MSLITPDHNFALLAILFIIVAFSIIGDQKRWFGNISGALVAIILAAILTSISVIPSGSNPDLSVPVYNFAFTYLIPFSVPLLLFNIQLKQILQRSGRLMGIFVIGAIGVVIGAVLSGLLLDLGDETYKLAAVYTATYIGGSVNFMAVADTFDFLKSPLFAASIVVDNTLTIFYIMLLFLMPKMKLFKRLFPFTNSYAPSAPIPKEAPQHEALLEQIATSLAISAFIVIIGKASAPYIEQLLNTDIKLDLLLITMLILIAANVFPKPLQRLEQTAFQLGTYMLYFFLAVIGASCDLKTLFTASPKVLLFALITLLVHLAFTLLLGRWFKYSIEEIAISSGANAGGVSISAPMAASFGLKEAVTPAILIGIMGYVLGTFLGIGVGILLR